MATSTPIPPNNIKSAARKLPIKRKTPLQTQTQIQSSLLTPLPDPILITNPNPNPNFSYAEDEYEFGCDDDESVGGGSDDLLHDPNPNPNPNPPPFKFHRIWSESDEIRFLQGLLGCYSQGLVFPRDLNLFYDRFSESMPQPYTRSQLSEKLRRLRKKYRIVSNRIARGLDPTRLAPHDRDLLHLCTRLWHADHASTSPFATPDAPSSKCNKRRRPNPLSVSTPTMLPAADAGGSTNLEFDNDYRESRWEEEEAMPPVPPASETLAVGVAGNDDKEMENTTGYVTAKTVLDVLDGSLEEVRRKMAEGHSAGGDELARRWSEQRVAELDVFAQRLRLVLEQSLLG